MNISFVQYLEVASSIGWTQWFQVILGNKLVHLASVDFRCAMPRAGYAYAEIYEDVLLVDENIS